MLLDANSGAFHLVDDIVYELVDYYKKYDVQEIIHTLEGRYDEAEVAEAIGELKSLEEQGLLYTEDPYENAGSINKGEAYVKALCLNIAHDCNLRCEYCFASKGEYKGKRSLMSAEVGKAAIDYVIKSSGPRKNIEVDLFGGEPLMNMGVVREIVDYGREMGQKKGKEIRFTITTNALLLDDSIIDYLDKNMSNIVLSIDGRKEINDAVRVRVDGTGTYDSILPRIKKMVSRRTGNKQYYVRGTFTAKNLDFFNDVIELADQGFKEISIEPVVLPDNEELALREDCLETIFSQYDRLAAEILAKEKTGKGFKFYHFNIDINGGPCIYKRVSGCGAGFEYIAITPEGDIYPCHQFVGNDKYKMGSVFDDTIDESIRDEFKNGNIYNKSECRECWAKFYCSGGCQANNYNFNGSILKPYSLGCRLQKKRIECALMIKASRFLERETSL
jgi:uncharacterized protein